MAKPFAASSRCFEATMSDVCCPLCHTTAAPFAKAFDVEYFTSTTEFEFYHCVGCDILFLSPMPADQLDVIYPANYYSFGEGGKSSFAFRLKGWLDRRMLRGLIAPIKGDELSVMDVGGGSGWIASAARDADPRVAKTLVVDLDGSAKVAAEANGHRYFCGRIEDFETTETFELILMLNLVEHVPRPDQILRRVGGLLSSNGRLLIKTPNFRSLDARIFRHRSWGGYHCPRHFVLFSRKSIIETLKRSGLAVEKFSYTQGAPFWTISILHELGKLGLIRSGPGTPYHLHPLAPYLQMIAAAFDFARMPFSPTSQMFIVAQKAARAAEPFNKAL
jgi:SAM-dependent methyltransferase